MSATVRAATPGEGMERLLAPHEVAGLSLRNRIAMPPMTTRLSGPDGGVSAREVAFWGARARGGAGLVICGPFLASTEVEDPLGRLRADDDRFVAGIRRLVDAVHDGGAAAGAQLTVGLGRLAPRAQSHPVSSSATTTPDGRSCRALTGGEIRTLIDDAAAAAVRLARAGVDLIDIGARAGGLVDQFLTPLWNHRTDEWGGDLTGRAALLLALVDAVREAGLPVSVRLSLDQHLPGGRGLTESIELVRMLGAAGVGLVTVEEGSPEAPWLVAPDYHQPAGAHLDAAVRVRSATGVPVLVAGATSLEQASKAVGDDEIDLVGLGRALVADPELPARVMAGQAGRVRPCVRCNACLDAVRAGRPLRCAVNPFAGEETVHAVRPVVRVRKVVVIGGGPAGLEAARMAAIRGHAVDLYEARPRIGGVLARAASPGFKSELLALVSWYGAELADLGVTIHLGRTVRSGSHVLAEAEVVVLATGARPVRPEITGLDRPEVIDVLDVHGSALGSRVVMIGGGLSGADTALDLAARGHRVTLVEAGDEIAPGSPSVSRAALLAGLEEQGVPVLTGTIVQAVDDLGVHAVGPDGPVELPTDSVVLAVGVLPSRELAAGGVLEDPRVHLVGDCVSPGSLGDAVRSGFAAGLTL
ncbi:FAD-dependent oxidoreductase [Actinotalea sp. M2MS4P-6]|uniref:FAD-dependent oxidoreductase n=1 Tax=Actinotalea sp. M2MS4P-6 TaxID=2983762 RepID=UPI0021E38AEA|nr:FAD-dependent oxidoreductase [Actinotalea sp. M2MS4P-6]MCV2395880.1 FAD-dependent oxidoreductase [Actinotalea sp. M2MS4P-6]